MKYQEKNMKIYLKVLMKDQKNMYQRIKQEELIAQKEDKKKGNKKTRVLPHSGKV